MLETNQGKWS